MSATPRDTIVTSARWRGVLLFAGLWTLVGLSFAGQFYISSAKAGSSVSWSQAVLWSLGDWYVFALLSWPAGRWVMRHPIEKSRWVVPVLKHLVGSALFSAAYMVLRAGLGQVQGYWTGRPTSFAEAFAPLLVKTWHLNLLIYWVILAVVHAMENARKYQERARRTVELERGLVEARLQALQMQLNPHFLFNTLHSISTLMHRDVELADRMIARLGDLLRYSLDNSDTQEVSLDRELEALELYLDIEQTRFGPRLATEFAIANETREAMVPNLILQPIVENAIRHGIEPTGRAGLIEIESRKEGTLLVLEIRDNGTGLKPGAREGVGMSNTRARMKALYGEDASVFAGTNPSGGCLVRLRLPFRPGPIVADELRGGTRATGVLGG